MINTAFSIILCASLGIIVFLGIFILTRCESKKRTTYIGMLMTVFLYILGYLLEIGAQSTDGAFIARKVLYIGAMFSSPLLLFFMADYCDIKINRGIIAVLLSLSLFIITLVWTTDTHKLFYASFELDTASAVHYLKRTSGPLHFTGHAYTFICMILAVIVLIYKCIKLDAKNRSRLILLAVGVFICVMGNILYLFNPFNLNINYTSLAAVIFTILSCINIMKNDMFSIIPRASEIALDSMSDALVLLDTNFGFLNANESAKKIFPSVGSLEKFSPINRINGWPPELSAISGKESGASVMFSMPDEIYYNANISPIIAKKSNLLGYIILIQNITESVLLTKKLEEIAYTDALTGILNRRHFMSLASTQFERINRQNSAAYIVMFDLDHFKKVNDTYGHLAGDMVLKSVTEKVKNSMRLYDLFGRYGGEEFILLIFDINYSDIKAYVERIRLEINKSPVEFEDMSITVSASFGVASVVAHHNLDDIIRIADEALYRAKKEGRNRVVMAQEAVPPA